MDAVMLNERCEAVAVVAKAEPICGRDMCDTCGDCLHCYGDEPCAVAKSGHHAWYVYASDVEDWKREHGL